MGLMRPRTVTLRLVLYAVAGFVVLQAIGILGFSLIMDEGVVDAFYRTVILISTVGLDTLPETAGAKLFSVFLVACGVALFLYVVGLLIELAVSGIVSGAWQERRIRRSVSRLKGHYVICGYGRVGRRVADEFRAAGAEYVVVDHDPHAVTAARKRGELAVEGSATDDDVLEDAGIGLARGLVACLGTDAENLFVVLSARELAHDLLIVARASNADAGTKLLRGGADRVVTPYDIAGKELATMVLKPQVSAFLDLVTGGASSPEFGFEQIEVTAASGLAGSSVRSLRIRERTGALVIAHRRPGTSFDTRPDPDTPLGEGDVLIAVGTADELRALEELFRSSEAVA
jgi:voltage-gated potassium channel